MKSSIGRKDTKLTYNSFLHKATHLQVKNPWLCLYVKRELLFKVNYVLNRLRIAFTHTKNTAQTNFTREIWPNFFMFKSTSILPSVQTNERKQFHCLNIVLNNITGLLFFSLNLIDVRARFSFKNTE